ncbi:hypothetical protein [Pseudactinotalea terrae]|uniref:hypothetical protein n=1 Tax=Pseudactinotalea terrae TaxID=1743262 RepID=UPI0012E29E01|nr:hypothetical protein [Pseudactinotalea terrae]
MSTTRKATAAVVCLTALLAASACSSTTQEPDPTTSAVPQAAPSAEATETPEPTQEPTPEVVIPSEAGAVVAPELVEQARDAGVALYVSPTGDGNGIVVDPDATLPEELINEVETVEGVPTDAGHLAEQLGLLTEILYAHDDAGTKLIAIAAMANVTGSSAEIIGYSAIGSAATGTFDASGGKAEVLAAAQAYAAANPGTTIVDLTD